MTSSTCIGVLALSFTMVVASTLGQNYEIHSFKKLHLTQTFYGEGANIGDFNKDGHNDVVSGPYWYEGPDFETKHEYYPAKPFDPQGYSDNFFAFTHDLNGDEWVDILIVGFPGKEARWYENPQGKKEEWPAHVVYSPVDNESPTFEDLTGDGKPEIICNSNGYFGYVEPDWENPSGAWTFHPVTIKGPWQRFTHGLGIGDVNGDGHKDILDAGGWWEQPASRGSRSEWKRHEWTFGTGGAQMYAYDVNGDGMNDVITSLAAHGYGLAWYEQYRENGQIQFHEHIFMNKEPEENKYGIQFSQLHALDLVDMDGDGLKDILTGKRYWAHGPKGDPEPNAPAVLYWFKLVRLPGGGVDFIPYRVDDDSGVGTQVVAGVIQGKLPDLVVGNKQGTFVFLHEVKKVDKEAWQGAQPQVYKQ